ncbi:response regulator transcription factor [bacterium SCSIO 12741]|nr:response regulator transcription factor [bacterium SCSIO 12741]
MTETTPNILLVEDDNSLGFVIKDNLEEQGYKVKLVRDGQAGFEAFYQQAYDLCLLDVMLPKKDGFRLATEIRNLNQNVPIIFLTAKSMMEDKIQGFSSGGDDYLTKPFAIEELLARMEAVLKRTQKRPDQRTQTISKESYPLGEITFNYKNLSLATPSGERSLTRKEADLLRLLCIHQNQVLEREVALKLIWGENDYFLGRSMDVFITRLRKYLADDKRIEIQNVHGVGFRLTLPEA